jgi:hypothetical protein
MKTSRLDKLVETLLSKVSGKYRRKKNQQKYIEMFSLHSAKDRFSYIYEKNLWSSKQSKSGTGSHLETTTKIREEIPKIITDYNIQSILDAPCGDFNWMKELIRHYPNIQYIGGDIVEPLIAQNIETYSTDHIHFQILDITQDELPKSDLMLVRDCLFHLSYDDIYKFLLNFLKSDIKYLLTTTHKPSSKFENKDILTGGFRFIDLFTLPFNFSNDPLVRIDDFLPGKEVPRQLCLFDRAQILSVIKHCELKKNRS